MKHKKFILSYTFGVLAFIAFLVCIVFYVMTLGETQKNFIIGFLVIFLSFSPFPFVIFWINKEVEEEMENVLPVVKLLFLLILNFIMICTSVFAFVFTAVYGTSRI